MVEKVSYSQLLNELKHHFDIVAESLESKIQFVAEGVVNVDQKLDRRFDALKQNIEKESVETRSLIKLSYTELDRRLAMLEGTVAALQSRVEAIEARNN